MNESWSYFKKNKNKTKNYLLGHFKDYIIVYEIQKFTQKTLTFKFSLKFQYSH